MPKKQNTDFIESYPNALPDEVIDYLLKFFEHEHHNGRTHKGKTGLGVKDNVKNSTDLVLDGKKYLYPNALKHNIFENRKECWYHDEILKQIVITLQEYSLKYVQKYFWVAPTDLRVKVNEEFGRDYLLPEDMINTQIWERFKSEQRIWYDGIFDLHFPEMGHRAFQVQKYSAKNKEGYHWYHWDQGLVPPSIMRWFVCMFYLNDVDEGGETEFYWQDKKIKPERGKLVMFPTFYTHLHKGNVPISNDKYILNAWLHLRTDHNLLWNWNNFKKK